jgi:hypothetical protein
MRTGLGAHAGLETCMQDEQGPVALGAAAERVPVLPQERILAKHPVTIDPVAAIFSGDPERRKSEWLALRCKCNKRELRL